MSIWILRAISFCSGTIIYEGVKKDNQKVWVSGVLIVILTCVYFCMNYKGA